MTELALLRVVAQRLAGPRPASPADAVAHLSALQGQDLAGAVRSVALRVAAPADPPTPGLHTPEVLESLASGAVVRSWPMRGTLHLVAARDLAWMLSLTRHRMEAHSARRREQLGLDDAAVARARDLAEAALADRRTLTRAELLAVWAEAGLLPTPGRAYHLIALLAIREVLIQGPPHPTRPSEQLFAAFGDWIPNPHRLDPDEALATWVADYFRGHGPATVQDFARWTGLPIREARRGLGAALAERRPGHRELARVVVDDTEYWLDAATPDLLATHRRDAEAMRLLPGFDELLLGYADRTATLPARWAEAVVPGKNGMFLPTVLHRGVVIGTWARHPRAVLATPFTRFTREQVAALARLGADVGDAGLRPGGAAPPRRTPPATPRR